MTDVKTCPFCEDLRKIKEINDYYRSTSQRRSVRESRTEYKVALVEESYEKSVDWCTGTVTHQQTDLNFCPVCGTKIEKEKT